MEFADEGNKNEWRKQRRAEKRAARRAQKKERDVFDQLKDALKEIARQEIKAVEREKIEERKEQRKGRSLKERRQAQRRAHLPGDCRCTQCGTVKTNTRLWVLKVDGQWVKKPICRSCYRSNGDALTRPN